MDAALVGAWFTGAATLVAAIGVVVKIVLTRPRLPVAEEVMEQLHDAQELVLLMAQWIAGARAAAALQGFDLPPLPIKLTMLTHPAAGPPPVPIIDRETRP